MNTIPFQPLQTKGESMDMEFTVDTDHRKRRRNRTTQSCLNCHTSKRKCDRKRPCQRCIQLGLTGLCVYEIDDPALRDDPTIDETTRLRNRIAELESLVRELRGKPHPRWADSSFRDGDPNEKWHSRATKCAPLKRRHSPDPTGGDRANPNAARAILPSLLTPIKTETANETPSHLYRFSPSPSSRYHQSFSGGGSYEGGASYSDGGGSGNGDYESRSYSSETINCSCRGQHSYATLAHHLDASLASLRQYSPHPSNTQCAIYRRITELRNMLQANEPSESGPSYDSNTPTDSEILTPLSASGSSHGPFHTSASPSSPHEWTTPGYNPYFPMQASEHGSIYNHIIT